MRHSVGHAIPRGLVGALVAATLTATSGAAQEYDAAPAGTRWLEREGGGTAIKILVERANLGSGEVEVAEITFPAGSTPSQPHTHGAIEIFYVLEGELEHVVNGVTHVVGPGQVGVVRPGDDVIHRIPGSEPVRALVIWAPGGEADRIAPFFTERPVDPRGGEE